MSKRNIEIRVRDIESYIDLDVSLTDKVPSRVYDLAADFAPDDLVREVSDMMLPEETEYTFRRRVMDLPGMYALVDELVGSLVNDVVAEAAIDAVYDLLYKLDEYYAYGRIVIFGIEFSYDMSREKPYKITMRGDIKGRAPKVPAILHALDEALASHGLPDIRTQTIAYVSKIDSVGAPDPKDLARLRPELQYVLEEYLRNEEE